VTTYHSSKLLQIELFLQMSTINKLIRVEQVNPKNIILMLLQVIETLKSRVEFAFLRVFGHGSDLREQGTWRKLEMTCHGHLLTGPALPVHFTLGDSLFSSCIVLTNLEPPFPCLIKLIFKMQSELKTGQKRKRYEPPQEVRLYDLTECKLTNTCARSSVFELEERLCVRTS